MTHAERLRLFRESLALYLAIGPLNEAGDAGDAQAREAADRLGDAADTAWYASDESGRNVMRWAGAAIERLEDACRRADVPAPPWVDASRSGEDTREAIAAFFGGPA